MVIDQQQTSSITVKPKNRIENVRTTVQNSLAKLLENNGQTLTFSQNKNQELDHSVSRRKIKIVNEPQHLNFTTILNNRNMQNSGGITSQQKITNKLRMLWGAQDQYDMNNGYSSSAYQSNCVPDPCSQQSYNTYPSQQIMSYPSQQSMSQPSQQSMSDSSSYYNMIDDDYHHDSDDDDLDIILGISLGGLYLICIISVLVYWYCCRGDDLQQRRQRDLKRQRELQQQWEMQRQIQMSQQKVCIPTYPNYDCNYVNQVCPPPKHQTVNYYDDTCDYIQCAPQQCAPVQCVPIQCVPVKCPPPSCTPPKCRSPRCATPTYQNDNCYEVVDDVCYYRCNYCQVNCQTVTVDCCAPTTVTVDCYTPNPDDCCCQQKHRIACNDSQFGNARHSYGKNHIIVSQRDYKHMVRDNHNNC